MLLGANCVHPLALILLEKEKRKRQDGIDHQPRWAYVCGELTIEQWEISLVEQRNSLIRYLTLRSKGHLTDATTYR